MRTRLQRIVLALVLVLATAPGAYAVTIHDIVALTKAGLSDDIILALLEADPTIFSIDAAKLMELRRDGVSERVLIAMLKSGREPAAPPPVEPAAVADPALAPDPVQQAPQVVIIEHEPQTIEYVVPYPVYYPTFRTFPPSRTHKAGEGERGFGRFVNDGSARFINDGTRHERVANPHESSAKPVYWGWGGQRRPDTWNEENP
jgi:hypothetical protein